MTFFFEELRRSSGTFRVELAATVFYAVYLAAQWPALVQASDWIAIPVALLAICYPVKVALMAWLVANGGESWDFGRSRVLVTWADWVSGFDESAQNNSAHWIFDALASSTRVLAGYLIAAVSGIMVTRPASRSFIASGWPL